MCDPVSIGMVAVSVAGTAVSTAGKFEQAGFEAKMAQNNAKIAGDQAAQAEIAGREQQDQVNRNIAATEGAQKAAFGASGVSLGEGTTSDVLASTAFKGQIDLNTIAQNTALKKWGFQVQQQNYLTQAKVDEASGFQALATGALQAGTSMLGAASQYNQATGLLSTYNGASGKGNPYMNFNALLSGGNGP